jgi:hypothetical protein
MYFYPLHELVVVMIVMFVIFMTNTQLVTTTKYDVLPYYRKVRFKYYSESGSSLICVLYLQDSWSRLYIGNT